MLKRTKLAFAALVISNLALAGAMGPACTHVSLNSLCASNRWSVGATALYVQPSFGGNGLGYTAFSNYSGNDNNGNFIGVSGAPDYMHNIFPRHDWGLQLDATYFFRTNDLMVNWYHLSTSRRSNFPVGYAFAGNNDGFYGSVFTVSSTWDEIDIDYGQKLQLTENKSAHLHGGLEFARIVNRFNNRPLLNASSVLAYTTFDTLSYSGFGPRLGIDLDYQFRKALRFYAKMAGSLLVGTAKQDNRGYQYYPYPNNPVSPFVTGNYQQSSNGVIVPEIAGKLGLQYDWQIGHQILGLDLGYLWVNYLNAILGYTGNGIVFANVGNQTTANYNLGGVYLGLRVAG